VIQINMNLRIKGSS